jgi:hypothetical protein
VDRLNLNTAVLSPVPTFIHTALSDSAWRSAMQAEFNALRAMTPNLGASTMRC